MKISVTAQDIAKGVHRSFSLCPVARAVTRAVVEALHLPLPSIRVWVEDGRIAAYAELTHAEAVRLAFGLLALGMFYSLREGAQGFASPGNSKEVMSDT